MATLEDELNDVRQKEGQILEKIDERNGNKSIQCASCESPHRIGDLTAIQTHWYTPPSGCNEGDYWNQGELQFVCPKTEVRNRLLFHNYDVPWEERKQFANDPQAQFKRGYKRLFREVTDEHEKTTPGPWVNNDYVDNNRAMFGLVKKRTQ